MERRAKAHARLFGEVVTEYWPCNSLEVPDNIDTLTCSELSIIVKTMHQLEAIVLSRSHGRGSGPLTTALSVTAVSYAKKSYFDILSRVGAVSSYQTIYDWRLHEIGERKNVGPFKTLKPASFVAVGIDNINL